MSRHHRPPARTRVPQAAPADDGMAALASRYLVDGYTPAEVAEKLGVSVEWSTAVLQRLRRPSSGDAA